MPNSKDEKNKKGKPTSPKTLKKGKKGKEAEVPKGRVVRVLTGMVLLLVSVYMIATFVSYIYTGADDYSLCQGDRPDFWSSETVVSNVGNKTGLLVSYFFINDCFGLASFLIPVFMMICALRLIGSYRFRLLKHFVRMGLLMIWLSIVLSVLSKLIPGIEDSHVRFGGAHGDAIHALLNNAVGEIGVYLIIALSVVFVVVWFSVQTVDKITEFFRFRQIQKLREMGERLKERVKHHRAGDDTDDGEEDDAKTFEDPQKSTTLTFDADGKLVDEPEEVDVAEQFDHVVQQNAEADNNVTLNPEDKPEADGEEPGFTIDELKETEKGEGTIERGDINTPYDPKRELEHYKYPTLDLLDKGHDDGPSIDMAEQTANKERIIKVLRSFGVEISSIRATIGPTITLYEITLSEGTRINKIRNLEDDIALSIKAKGIRIIAPIPGKGTVGIEVPNNKPCIVSMESILNSKTYQESKMELPCAIGKTITNEVFMVDLAKAPHMLVAGATGMGKSVGLNAIITSLLYKKHPSELKMVMVDPKKVEFSVYAPIANQFLAKLEDEEEAIITDNQRVIKTLQALCKLMDDRYVTLKSARVRNIKEYNEKFKARQLSPLEGYEYMPYYVVVIDEFGDLIMTAGKEIEVPICRIAQLARAVGIHMIIATQRPTTRIITGTIKANFPARVAFKVSSMIDSRIILDRPGANQLIGRGDMLYLQSADPVRVQCAFVDTPEVERICQYISQQQKFPEMTYLPEPPMEEGGSGSSDVDTQSLDAMFADVARMVVAKQAGSTSNIQRQFSIGYNRAGKLMDQLERTGVVGPQIGSKPREVLIQDLNSLETLLQNLGVN
ncbi:MAG: DNA translocase FtsK 4TM domain-containing protein [Bacteroidaceae bacterium]|nr:DNA translocase FtsK 4TM domain-containing protein [Bacteroidaceae bacterium]